MRIVRRRTERCRRDGRPVSEPPKEEEDDALGEREVDVNVIVRSGTEGPCWARMGVGVPSCETCTPSYARCDDASEDDDDDDDDDGVDGDLTHMSVLRYRDDDARVEDWVVSMDTDTCLEDAEVTSCALRSTPSTILEPDG